MSKQEKENTLVYLRDIDSLIKDRYEIRANDKQSLSIEEYSRQLQEATKKYIPNRFKEAEISDKSVEDFMLGEFSTHSRGLYLYGDCGTGKTYNLYGVFKLLVANKLLKQIEEIPSVINIVEFFSELKQTFEDSDSEAQIVDKIKTDRILLIDDFGTEKLSDWTIEACYRLINHRYVEMKPTFFSSNLSLEEIAKRMGDRFASRIAEMCKIIKIEGEDRRLRTNK